MCLQDVALRAKKKHQEWVPDVVTSNDTETVRCKFCGAGGGRASYNEVEAGVPRNGRSAQRVSRPAVARNDSILMLFSVEKATIARRPSLSLFFAYLDDCI